MSVQNPLFHDQQLTLTADHLVIVHWRPHLG
uniref:LUT1 n=1 Tax=Arundo donax TaxID=35708 RepID=A0A0A9E3M5_ARUDO